VDPLLEDVTITVTATGTPDITVTSTWVPCPAVTLPPGPAMTV
jgi:hypothetical protein